MQRFRDECVTYTRVRVRVLRALKDVCVILLLSRAQLSPTALPSCAYVCIVRVHTNNLYTILFNSSVQQTLSKVIIPIECDVNARCESVQT